MSGLCTNSSYRTCYNLVTVNGTQVHLTTTTTTHKERTYTMSIDNLLDLIIQYKEAAQLIETAQAEQEAIKAVAPALFTQYSKVVTGQRLTIN